jgi:hypothetical protein
MPFGRERRRAAASADKESPEFWRGVATGGYIALSDAEAFAASLSGPAGGSGSVDYPVGEIRSFALRGPETDRAGGASASAPSASGCYRFIELRGETGPLYLAVVDLAERFELRLYFTPQGLESGTRDELIDRGDTWLFLPPADPEDFISSELEYAPFPDVPEIEERDPASGRAVGRKLVFGREGPASLYGESEDTGAAVIITEYRAEPPEAASKAAPEAATGPENPLLFVLEEGWMRPDGSQPEAGGYVTIFLGKPIRPSELEYYPA